MNKNEILIDLLGLEHDTIQLSDDILTNLNVNVGVKSPEAQALDGSFLDMTENIRL